MPPISAFQISPKYSVLIENGDEETDRVNMVIDILKAHGLNCMPSRAQVPGYSRVQVTCTQERLESQAIVAGYKPEELNPEHMLFYRLSSYECLELLLQIITEEAQIYPGRWDFIKNVSFVNQNIVDACERLQHKVNFQFLAFESDLDDIRDVYGEKRAIEVAHEGMFLKVSSIVIPCVLGMHWLTANYPEYYTSSHLLPLTALWALFLSFQWDCNFYRRLQQKWRLLRPRFIEPDDNIQRYPLIPRILYAGFPLAIVAVLMALHEQELPQIPHPLLMFIYYSPLASILFFGYWG